MPIAAWRAWLCWLGVLMMERLRHWNLPMMLKSFIHGTLIYSTPLGNWAARSRKENSFHGERSRDAPSLQSITTEMDATGTGWYLMVRLSLIQSQAGQNERQIYGDCTARGCILPGWLHE